MEKMFEKAARIKLRFSTPKGLLTVEDLFDLPLTSGTGKANLDDLAKELHRQLKDEDVSFVTPTAKKDEDDQLAFELVKHVIGIRIAERDEAAKKTEQAAARQKIMALIDQKKDAALGEKSVEELTALLASLSA